MKIIYTNDNIFDIRNSNPESAVCITTNAMVKSNKKAVMGKGIALEASNLFKNLSKDLADKLIKNGNHTYLFEYANIKIITFPTKHNWQNPSNILLIMRSARELVQICNENNIDAVYLPPVGCGNGQLDWEYVSQWLEQILDDRFVFIIRTKYKKT